MKFSDYTAAGWKLCGIDRGKKAPTYDAWNTKPIDADAVDGLDGAGLLHALSGTCALDIDHMELARPWLAERGVDIDALLDADDAVRIDSGRPGRAKLLYRLTRPLRTFKPKDSGLELRCATGTGSSVQDVLPPTVHPDTKKPYQWSFGLLGDWRSPPTIPTNLLSVWRDLAEPIDATAAEPVLKTKLVVDLAKLRKAAFTHSPDCEYDEWLKVGMQLHQGTRGAQQGLDIWCDWSRGIKRKPYPGDALLKTHYVSFGDAPGKRVATGDALLAELPAEAEDFEVLPTEVTDAPAPAAEGIAAERAAALEKLIKRFVFVVWEQEYFDADRNALIGDKAIRHLLTPYMPRKGGREVDPVEKLMRSRAKTSVEALAFHPGEASIFTYNKKRYANTFVDRSPTPIEPMKDELEKIEWLFGRIDDVPYREWLLQFYAHVVQHPGIKIRTAPLIWSKVEGNGKSTIVGTIPQLLVGSDYYTEVTQGELNSDHNDFLIGKWLVTLAEFRAGTRGEREAISKKVENWVADDILAVHPKGTKGYSIPNHLVITASTNKDDAALIDANNRKWAVHHLTRDGVEVPEMTEAEKAWLFEGFLRTERAPAVLRHYFLHYPITTFNPHASAPKTASRQAMIDSSVPADLELLITAFEQKSEPLSREVVITADVADYVRKHCSMKPSNDRIGRLLSGPPFNGVAVKFRAGGGVYRAMAFKPKWVRAYGKEIMAHINGEDTSIDAVDEQDELLL